MLLSVIIIDSCTTYHYQSCSPNGFSTQLKQRCIGNGNGMAPATATVIEARFVPLAVDQGMTTAWTHISFLPGSSAFEGQVSVSAGWYRLDVRATANNTVIAQTQVNRVGVGEVFVVAGQSNVYGHIQRVLPSYEDRVSCVDFQQDSLSDQLLPLQFSHITYGSSIGPSQPPHLWSMLGDKLVKRLNVPVLFLGAALGGSSSTEWQQGAIGNLGTTTNSAVYRRLGEALLHYVTRTGARAVLWHQGETDTYNGTSYQTYYNNLNTVLQKSRQQLGASPIAWMISRVSYNSSQTSPAVISAQNQLISSLSNVFPGPASDSIVGPDNRPDYIHMKGPGLTRFINSWDQALSASFFQNAVPYIPTRSDQTLITSGYTLPLSRRQGDVVAVASLRSNPYETDNQYIAQLIRVSDGAIMYESAPGTDNPILITIPQSLPDGQYQFRTNSTHPVVVGTLSEPFSIQRSTPSSALLPVRKAPVRGGTADIAIKRFTYSYEPDSHGFFALVEATAPVEVRLERIDGGSFSNSGWNLMPPSSQAPDYEQFAEFNYIRNYPPTAFGVGGVEPGKYRYSVRLQGDSGPGLWYDLTFLGGRMILYQNETPPPIPPVLSISNPLTGCQRGSIQVTVDVTDGTLNSGNGFSVRLSDATGSFTNETTIGTGTSSLLSASIPPDLPTGNTYKIRVVASNPAVASAPSSSFSICSGGADLAMALSSSARTPSTNQPVTLTVVVTNSGPLTANKVMVQSLLPEGMAFIDAVSSGISVTGNTVTIDAGTLNVDEQLPFVYRLKATQPGSFAISAQIMASDQTDPDSQPNSGTGDGQDDTAIIDLRTPDASGQFYASPNPNQVPLPPVQSNQPPADPTKADLSLAVRSSSLAVTASQVATFSLVVRNEGGATAGNVSVQTLLPPGWQLTDTNGLTINGQTVTGTIESIPAGGTGTLVLSVRVSSAGTLRSQVLGASPADPDSTPGNGYTNGEDDEASINIRIM